MAHRREGKQTCPEAWLWLELYPPFGMSADEARPALIAAIEAGLADLDAATADHAAMHQAMLDAAQIPGLKRCNLSCSQPLSKSNKMSKLISIEDRKSVV